MRHLNLTAESIIQSDAMWSLRPHRGAVRFGQPHYCTFLITSTPSLDSDSPKGRLRLKFLRIKKKNGFFLFR